VSSLGPASLLPILAGAFYAMGNIATREWCEGESPETLLLGFFAALGILGLAGMAVLSIWHPVVPPGADGFVLRGPVWPSQTFLFWTFVQAVGSLVGVGMMVRAYQIAEASRVAIFEYVVLPMSALWAWVLWGDVLTASAAIGIVLIIAAGVIIALRGK
jgi:drug/metabolite transporter (DMT)-like permease